MKMNGTERTITNLKDSGILPQMSWLPISNTADIQSSELPVRWSGILEEEKVGNVRFTSVRILRMQILYFARTILQISSVSTEQSRIGAIN